MPIYQYLCENCLEQFDVIQKFSDQPLTTHEKCGGPVHRMLTAPAFQFKGSGWYVTDYANKTGNGSGTSGESASSESSEAKGESKAPGKSDGKSDGKPDSKSESKPETKSENKSSDSSSSAPAPTATTKTS